MSAPARILRKVIRKYSRPMTLSYPSTAMGEKRYSQIPPKLRGIPERDLEKCIGCKACYYVCSGRATTPVMVDGKLVMQINLSRCTFCGHCEEACPEEAIKMTPRFELAVRDKTRPEMFVETTLDMAVCACCGRPFIAQKQLKRSFERLNEKIDKSVRDEVAADFRKVEQYCPECKRARSVGLDTHTKKHVWVEGA